jgi:UDP-3-O-[3-hydroxymyristoyl] glucosamine N-acyltransferase
MRRPVRPLRPRPKATEASSVPFCFEKPLLDLPGGFSCLAIDPAEIARHRPAAFVFLPVNLTLQQLADLVGGEILRGEGNLNLTGFASLKEATAGDISFFGNERYVEDLAQTGAGVVLLRNSDVPAPESCALVRVDNPVMAFDVVLRKYAVPKPAFVPGVHPTAAIAEDAVYDPEKVSIGALAVVEAGVEIGEGTRIGSGAVVGQGSRIGRDCEIASGVFIQYGCILGDRVILHSGVVLGADGFGFEFVNGRHQKVEQLGIVRVEDDVEIGASTTVDRARFGETVIGEGTKIDNQVQIGHNVIIGKHCIVVAQSGISGSTRIGDYVTLAARVGIAGHLKIGDGAILAARSGVITDVEAGEKVFGYPSKPFKEAMRTSMFVKRLGGLFDRVKKLEQSVNGGRGD